MDDVPEAENVVEELPDDNVEEEIVEERIDEVQEIHDETDVTSNIVDDDAMDET